MGVNSNLERLKAGVASLSMEEAAELLGMTDLFRPEYANRTVAGFSCFMGVILWMK